jgi:hypothetical protein
LGLGENQARFVESQFTEAAGGQKLDPGLLQQGQYAIVTHVTAIVQVSDTQGYVAVKRELFGQLRFERRHGFD